MGEDVSSSPPGEARTVSAPGEAEARRRGRVHLVGAGPGDPGLLTARALELIARADTVLYDRLIPAGALEGARTDAELLFVGKQGGGESVAQEQTQALMIERARAGREVVRLKGGDPFVFGRGGEEALALREAGIEFSVVPGVTAGVAAAAYAGIPVTHRGLSTGVALVTGHTRQDATQDAGRRPGEAARTDADDCEEACAELDWQGLAAFPGTLVFYMGVRQLPHIAERLIAAGRAPSQPVAIVERGTLPDQRSVSATLASIVAVAERERVKAPAVTIVGAVAGLAESLHWLPALPLAGRSVAVTRARAQASGLARRLTALGASVIEAPTIRVRALDGPPLEPAPYDLICLTSANGVEYLFERLAAGGRDARSLAGARVAAIGPGTARALDERGIAADVVPERFLAESLVEALRDFAVEYALVATASGARTLLPDALRARGARVDVLALYETVAEPLSETILKQAQTADYIAFTSSSSVLYFLDAARARGGYPPFSDTNTKLPDDGSGPDGAHLSPTTRIVSIGPVTSATLRERGLEPHVEATRHDVDGLLEALLADAER
ncbi:MAG TPA: uroporphyrinogen-III C-methyltransferase [Solirubrobacteraceae bacterium]|jgi:uroporphyrinogen III methyltransferase/synthase|nr:uroporphyrinogen-III C-methyltransferase [Solirubrobacteraceae bacterium]